MPLKCRAPKFFELSPLPGKMDKQETTLPISPSYIGPSRYYLLPFLCNMIGPNCSNVSLVENDLFCFLFSVSKSPWRGSGNRCICLKDVI